MKIIDRYIDNYIARKNVNVQQKEYSPNLSIISNQKFAEEYDLVSDFVYNCIVIRALNVAALKWDVYSENGNGNLTPLKTDNEISKLFFTVNPEMTVTQLLAQSVYWLDFVGNCYIKVSKDKNKFAGLYLLPANEVIVSYNNNGKWYNYKGAYFNNDEIIHLKSIMTYPNGMGHSIIEKSKDTIETYKSSNNFLKRFMEKDGMPPSYLTTPAGVMISKTSKDDLLSKWNALFGNRYKLDLTLEQGMDIKTVGQSISFNVDRFKEINETLKKDITFIFQIPLSKITGENANYATAQINEKAFYDSAIKPIAKQISDGFTDYFRRIGYSDVLIGFEEKEFDLSNLQGITQDISNSVNDNNSNNEENKQLRKQLELKEKQVTEIEKQFIWKSYENIRDKYEKTIYKRLYDVKQSIIKSVKEDIQKASTEKDYNIEITITKDKIFDMIVKKLKVPASNLIKYTLRNVLNNLTGSVIQVNEEAVINSVLKRFYEKAIISSDNMLEQMKNEIKQIVNKPIDEYITVIDKISSHFSVKTSTNTVTTYSMNNTIKDVALLNKDKTKLQWLSQRDMSVRDAHAEADGQTIESDGMFNIGGELMSHPAGGSVAENNINCRCYMKVIKSEI